MRTAEIIRTTKETDISLTLNLDGAGISEIHSGCGFLDHMLTLFSRHARFDLTLTCKGDVEVDYHHTAEDIGIALGDAFSKALGDKKGIVRYGNFLLPMDETLVLSAVDISGRSHLEYSAPVRAKKVGDFDTELVEEFFEAFVRNAKITLHIMKLNGKNSHHILEAVYKSVAKSLKQAVAIDEDYRNEIPSTKGVL
ncbi:MAG: imidazoleglycerol-phosphate dehydratase HisB [Oscillospiraceae bacterium]|nr:imidazoleglycerol-phosphate dehydratase HisB [Oscillospiraceae bacterium]